MDIKKCKKIREGKEELERDSLLENLNDNGEFSEAFIQEFSHEDNYFESLCPHCYADTNEVRVGDDDGHTHCSEGCGNLEAYGHLEVQAFPHFKIMAVFKKGKATWQVLPEDLLDNCIL